MEGSFRGRSCLEAEFLPTKGKLGRNKERNFYLRDEEDSHYVSVNNGKFCVLFYNDVVCTHCICYVLIQIQLTKFAFVVFSTWLVVCLSIRWLYYYLACSLSTE